MQNGASNCGTVERSNCKVCEMERQTVGQFTGATVRHVKWSVKLWDSLKEQL